MWLTKGELKALCWLGGLALLALGVLAWQHHRAPIRVEPAVDSTQALRWDRALEAARRVDINTAGVAELERLPGVGPALASRIVAYRSRHGRFRAARELIRVPGIGSKTYDALDDYVTVR